MAFIHFKWLHKWNNLESKAISLPTTRVYEKHEKKNIRTWDAVQLGWAGTPYTVAIILTAASPVNLYCPVN